MTLTGCNSVENEYLRHVQMSYSLEFYTTNKKQDFLVISLVLREKKEQQIIIFAKLLRPNVSVYYLNVYVWYIKDNQEASI